MEGITEHEQPAVPQQPILHQQPMVPQQPIVPQHVVMPGNPTVLAEPAPAAVAATALAPLPQNDTIRNLRMLNSELSKKDQTITEGRMQNQCLETARAKALQESMEHEDEAEKMNSLIQSMTLKMKMLQDENEELSRLLKVMRWCGGQTEQRTNSDK